MVESLTGNTKSFADYFMNEYSHDYTVVDPKEVNRSGAELDLTLFDKVIIGCYTWNNGRVPLQTKNFIISHYELLKSSDLLVYGSGWTNYIEFCGAVDRIENLFKGIPTIKYELRFDPSLEVEAIETIKQFLEE